MHYFSDVEKIFTTLCFSNKVFILDSICSRSYSFYFLDEFDSIIKPAFKLSLFIFSVHASSLCSTNAGTSLLVYFFEISDEINIILHNRKIMPSFVGAFISWDLSFSDFSTTHNNTYY